MTNKIDPLGIIKSCRDMDVQEIIRFFYAHGPRFWSWGSHNFVNIKNRGFRFNVQGHHHTGHVYIFLNGLDLFDVYLTSTHGSIKEEIKDVYITDIFEILDKKIEYIDIYES